MPSPTASIPQEKKIIKAIEVKGNNTIGLSLILAKIKSRVGEEYLQSVISDDLKRLYNMGYFSDVSVDREDYEGGFRVIFYVEEKPIVEKITFSKTKYFKPAAILRKMKTKEGKFLDNKGLKDDIKTIEEMYAKKGLTLANVRVEKEVDPLTNKTKLHFVIKEGIRVKVKRIEVMGNETFPRRKILRVIKTRPDTLFTSGYLKEDVLKEDMERIKSFYEKEGFIDAQASVEYEEYRSGRINVKIQITEGKRYYIDEVVIEGNTIVSDKEIQGVIKEVKPGNVFSRERLTVDLANIRTLYFDKGYIFANVRESTTSNPDTGKVVVNLGIFEGELAYIHRIKIQGNTRTRDIVIRRELKLFPNDRFDGVKLRKSKQRLKDLGYFEDIGYDIEDTATPNKKDLVVNVKEAKTGTFSFGGGYSSIDQLVGFVEIQQKNFDFTNWPTFTGGGQDILLRAETGSTRNNMRLSFTEPWLFDYPISGGFDAYITEREKEQDVGYSNDEKRVGGDLRFGKQFTDIVSGSVTYRWEKITIGNFDDNVTADLLAEEGKNTVSSLGFALVRDTRDSSFSPTQGLYLRGSLDFAGGYIGGDKDFYRMVGMGSYFVPLKFNSVLEFRLRTGIVDAYGDSDRVPIFERFFAGGAKTIRGYEERSVGPLDSQTDDPLGGETILVGNIEYLFPLVDFIKLATFFDVGNVWQTVEDYGTGEFKAGAGLGLRIKTPIGPVSLDYGYPLNDEPGEEDRSGKFYFSISRGF